jgi:hypothetical protein
VVYGFIAITVAVELWSHDQRPADNPASAAGIVAALGTPEHTLFTSDDPP